MGTPSKFPVFAATPGKDLRRHSLLYSPSFAKIKGGHGGRTPADIIKRATGGTAPMRVSPLAELDTSETLGHVSTPVVDRSARELTSSPIGMASPGVEEEGNDSFRSASDSPTSTPKALKLNAGRQASLSPLPGDRLSFSAYSHTAEMGTSPFPDNAPAAPASRRWSKEVTLHTDVMIKEVERIVERIVHVQVPGPERIVEVIKEVPVERIVIKEVPVYVDRVVESDRVVTTVREVCFCVGINECVRGSTHVYIHTYMYTYIHTQPISFGMSFSKPPSPKLYANKSLRVSFVTRLVLVKRNQ